MADRTLIEVSALGGALIGVLSAAYQATLSAPAAIAARPELANLPFWTALFSGRFSEWVFYTHPTAASVAWIALWTLIVTTATVVST